MYNLQSTAGLSNACIHVISSREISVWFYAFIMTIDWERKRNENEMEWDLSNQSPKMEYSTIQSKSPNNYFLLRTQVTQAQAASVKWTKRVRGKKKKPNVLLFFLLLPEIN